jgi:hypothetical protein
MAKALSPLEEAIAEAFIPKAPSARLGLLDAPWQGELRNSTVLQRGLGGQQQADPIFTPLFSALFSTTFLGGAASYTLFGGAISAATVASAIATTALTIGLQYAMAPKPPKPEDGRAPLTQPIPYRFYGVGESRAAGAFMLWEAKDNVLISVQALMGHRVQGNASGDGFVKYYLNDDLVTLGGDDGHQVVPPAEYPSRYSDRVRILTRMGEVPETPYSEVVDKLSADGVWTNDHRLDGQASMAMLTRAVAAKNFTKRFPNGRPTASVVGRWARCWDFRDPDQNPDDDSTWKWTLNPVVQFGWHLCFNPYGEKRDFRRAILPVLDMWQEEADVCDEDVGTAAGGTRKRYQCSGYDTTEHGPKSSTNAILASFDGWMCTRGDGAVLIVAGQWREKYCATLTDSDIVGYDKQNDVLPDDEINRFTPKFNYPATNYTTTDTDFFEDTAAQIKAGRVLAEEGHYDFVTEWRQARALGKRDWIRMQQKVSGKLYVGLTGINAAYAPWIKLETPVMIPSLNGKVMSNRKATIDLMHGGFQIDINKMPDNPADIDAWNPATDEGAAPPVPAKPISDGVPTPLVDTITVLRQSGSVYLRITLVDPSRDDLTAVFHYRLADDGTGNPGPWSPDQTFPDVTPNSGLLTLDTGAVPGDRVLGYQVAYIGANGSYGPWTTETSITTTVDTTAPQALLSFTASNGSAQFSANFGTENDSHLSTVAIYRVASGGPAPAVTDTPAARPAVSPGIAYAVPVSAPAGTWDIYVRPFNGSNVAGPLAGPEPVTVT